MSKTFEVIEKETVYNGFFKMLKYKVKHSLFNGSYSEAYTRELLDRGHAVAIFLYDPSHDTVVLIEQFRIGAIESSNPWVVELVAGMVEKGESIEGVARREVEEECGAAAGELQFIADFYSSVGGSSEMTSLFYSEVDSRKFDGVHGLSSENEDIRTIKLSSTDFINKLKNNEFSTASLITAGYWFLAEKLNNSNSGYSN